ncbi:hypothetical protein BDQ17DRAFT_1434643 [Cyathus striatus]|nr:hypothetical protein BDQ17DRAFT_1434643 [Cyathus striatus]
MTNFMDSIKERIIPPIPHLLELYAPLLVEAKRAATRHASVVKSKFANETKVLLVAATGEWWRRTLAVEFEETEYVDVQDKSTKLEFEMALRNVLFEVEQPYHIMLPKPEEQQNREKDKRAERRFNNKETITEARKKLRDWLE